MSDAMTYRNQYGLKETDDDVDAYEEDDDGGCGRIETEL